MGFFSTGVMMVLALLYLVASAVCFGMYAVDKQAAMGRRRRIPEMHLLIAGLLCGWPGGVLAQQLLRHKRRKQAFLWKFWLAVLLNSVALVCGLWKIGAG